MLYNIDRKVMEEHEYVNYIHKREYCGLIREYNAEKYNIPDDGYDSLGFCLFGCLLIFFGLCSGGLISSVIFVTIGVLIVKATLFTETPRPSSKEIKSAIIEARRVRQIALENISKGNRISTPEHKIS